MFLNETVLNGRDGIIEMKEKIKMIEKKKLSFFATCYTPLKK